MLSLLSVCRSTIQRFRVIIHYQVIAISSDKDSASTTGDCRDKATAHMTFSESDGWSTSSDNVPNNDISARWVQYHTAIGCID